MRAAPREQLVFQDDRVTITTTRAILGDVTYAMANITSVRAIRERRTVLLVILGPIVAFLGLLAVVGEQSPRGPSGPAVLMLLGGAALTAAYYWPARKNWVRIGTAGAESDAIWSRDPEWTATVVAAINQAIVNRG